MLIARIAELQSQVEWLKNENKSLVNVNQILQQDVEKLSLPTWDPTQDARQKSNHDFIKISRAKNFSPHKASKASPNRSPNATTTRLTRLNDANLNNRFSVLTVEESNNDESEERDERHLFNQIAIRTKAEFQSRAKMQNKITEQNQVLQSLGIQ